MMTATSRLVARDLMAPIGVADMSRECAWTEWQFLDDDANRSNDVSPHMEDAQPLVQPETPLAELVRVMVDEDADCVTVVDGNGAAMGTVSIRRVLAAMAG